MQETSDIKDGKRPWVSFCMTTYKRPEFLRKQLIAISKQTFTDFQVIISDNDPEASGKRVVEGFNDPRFFYYANEENLGMVKSFNRSLKRANSEYIVMITDDDPVYPEMLSEFHELCNRFPSYPIYCGFQRKGKEKCFIEVLDAENFVFQLLHPGLTENLLWSSCIMRKDILMDSGGFPDYGSPHLADHAMMAFCGARGGGVIKNKMYGYLQSHESNFSKKNLDLYVVGCNKFYNLMTQTLDSRFYKKGKENALIKHLDNWFIGNAFSLRRYYTIHNNPIVLKEIENMCGQILQLGFMRHLYFRYYFKLMKFYIKTPLIRMKILH